MRRLQTAKAFMDEHFWHYLLSNILLRIAIYLNSIFLDYIKSIWRITLSLYVEKRMEFAAGLLKDPNINVTDVASMAGFADVYSFSKAFKKYFRVAPSQFSIG